MGTGACERCGRGDDVGGFLDEWAMPPGFHFTPTDEELITQFLRKKAAGVPLPFGLDHIIPTLPIFGPGVEADPRHLFQRLPLAARRYPLVQGSDHIFAFTEWDHRSRPTRVAGPGTWRQNFRRTVADGQGRILGAKAHLTFKIPENKGGGAHDDSARKPGPTTHWVMHEFRLPDDADEEACEVGGRCSSNYKKDSKRKGRLVLCHIRYTEIEDKLKGKATAKPKAKDGADGAVFDDDDDVEEGKGLLQYSKKRRRRGGGEGSLPQEEDVVPFSAPAAVDGGVRPTTAYLAPAMPALDGSTGEPPCPMAWHSCTQPSTPLPPTWVDSIDRGIDHHPLMPPATAAAMSLYPVAGDQQELPPWQHTLPPLMDADVAGRPPMVGNPAAGQMDDAGVLHATPPGGVMAALEWDDIDLQMDEDMISDYCQLFFADSEDGDHGDPTAIAAAPTAPAAVAGVP